MTTEARLEELLLKWEESRRQGRHFSAQEVCVDCPDLAEELARRIKALEAYETVGASTNVDSLNSLSDSTRDRPDSQGGMLITGMSPLPGYRLLKRLGRGGFGEVWEAMAPGDFRVALKFVSLERERPNVEVAALDIVRTLRHPNLLVTFGAWQQDDRLIIAMELADRTLLDRFHEAVTQGHKGIPRDELLEYFRAAANGLDYLNERRHTLGDKVNLSIQHRDIKPQNILLVGNGVKLADFGLVRFLEHSVTGHTGNLTPLYAAPEFFSGQTSNASDQYSLAIAYCHLRGGKIPFGTSLAELIAGHVSGTPNLEMLPQEERQVVARALAKSPTDRWPSCREFVLALAASAPREESAPQPTRRRRAAAIFFGGVCISLIVAAFYAILNQPTPDKAQNPVATAPETNPITELQNGPIVSDSPTPSVQLANEPIQKAPPTIPPEQSVASPPTKEPTNRPAEPELIAVPPALATSKMLKLIVPDQLTLAWGETKSLPIQIQRQGPADAVRLKFDGFPAKVASNPVEVPANQDRVNLYLVAEIDAEEAAQEIILKGEFGTEIVEARIRLTVSRPTGQIRMLSGHKGPVRGAAFLPDGRHVVSGGDDGCLVLWDLETAKERRRIDCHKEGISAVVVTNDGGRALTSSLDHSVRVWDLNLGAEQCRFEKHQHPVECVALSPDGLHALSCDQGGKLWLWEVATGKEIRPFIGAEEAQWSVAFTADGRRAYSGGDSKIVRVWDVAKGKQEQAIDINLKLVNCVIPVPGEVVAVAASGKPGSQSSIQVRKLEGDTRAGSFGDYGVEVYSIAVSQTRRQTLSAGKDGTVRLWDTTAMTELGQFDAGQKNVVFAVAFSPNGRTALSTYSDGTVRLWALPK